MPSKKTSNAYQAKTINRIRKEFGMKKNKSYKEYLKTSEERNRYKKKLLERDIKYGL
jgi:hypothetical protein